MSAAKFEQIVPHLFGVHEKCGEWCSYNSDQATYRHRTLTTDLSGEESGRDLEAVFKVFSQNAEKIAPGGSTKDVESVNNMISSKAPKQCHFSASGKFLSQVGCAVAHRNLGNMYISSINERVGLSPGKISNALLHFAVKSNISFPKIFGARTYTNGGRFSCVERKIRGNSSYTPQQYVDKIQETRSSKPYKVHYVDYSFFENYTSLNYYTTIRPGTGPGSPVVPVLKYLPEGKIQYLINYMYNDHDYQVCTEVKSPSRRQNMNICNN